MTFRIPRGKHRARPLRFGLYWNRKVFTWKVRFEESCRYDLKSEDQLDTNKLCGIGYLPGHHKHSARFGWRYLIVTGQIELSAYSYVKGRRIIKHICFCDIGKQYSIELNILESWYQFFVYKPGELKHFGSIAIQHSHNKKLGYRLGAFFGGQARAPHEIKIQIEKV